MKWYKHDPDAFMAGTASLSLEEVGAYIILIDAFYSRDGNLSDDDFLLSRILRCDPRTWRKIKLALFQKQKVTVESGNLIPNRGLSTITEAKLYANSQKSQAEVRTKVQCESAEKPKENNDPPLPSTTTTTSRKKDPSDLSIPRKRAKTPFPEGWEPTLTLTERTEFEKFQASALAHGRIYANWDQAWRNWKLNAPNFTPARSVTQRNRETMDDLNSFIDQCAADAGSRRPPDAQGHLLLPDSKSDGAQGISERAGDPARDVLGRRGNSRDSQSNGSKP